MISANPISWVDQALTRKWDAITARVRPEWLPRQISGKKVRHFQEYGCGHYGCVYPTTQPGIVFKVTSDPTEAFFVAYVLRTKQQVDGLVGYHQVLAIEGESRRNRPVFVIVRDEAMHVGNVREVLDERETHRLRFSLYYMQDLHGSRARRERIAFSTNCQSQYACSLFRIFFRRNVLPRCDAVPIHRQAPRAQSVFREIDDLDEDFFTMEG
jgi:hypothetical protein